MTPGRGGAERGQGALGDVVEPLWTAGGAGHQHRSFYGGEKGQGRVGSRTGKLQVSLLTPFIEGRRQPRLAEGEKRPEFLLDGRGQHAILRDQLGTQADAAVLVNDTLVRREVLPEAAQRGGFGGAQVRQQSLDLGTVPLDEGGAQVGLAGEMVVDAGVADSQGGADVAVRDGREAALLNEVLRHVQNALAGSGVTGHATEYLPTCR